MINVTKPALPPLDEFTGYLETIWENRWITNDGPFHQVFEARLCEYLRVPYISVFSNGTLALMTALRALNITGEVITTPFSFIATTHSIWWNNLKPVFVDIEPDHYNLDPQKIEAAITEHTTAIMPVHVYGNPCKVEEIEKIAEQYKLKVIYDAAHAFAVTRNNQSILNCGDLSILSFHATKVYNTIEGGAIVCKSAAMKHHIDNLKNFGYQDEVTVEEPGINAKMNELQAAYGMLQLKYVDTYIEKRKTIAERYRDTLRHIPGIRFPLPEAGVKEVFSYFPIEIDEIVFGISRDGLYEFLKLYGINTRRYFYPLISHFEPYRNYRSAQPANLPVAEKATARILCLPIYPDLTEQDVDLIVELIGKSRGN